MDLDGGGGSTAGTDHQPMPVLHGRSSGGSSYDAANYILCVVCNLVIGSLLTIIGRHGGVNLACKVFDEMPERDVVSCNNMIRMYMDCGQVESAISLFESMPEETVVTWNIVITGLAKNGKMEAKEIL